MKQQKSLARLNKHWPPMVAALALACKMLCMLENKDPSELRADTQLRVLLEEADKLHGIRIGLTFEDYSESLFCV